MLRTNNSSKQSVCSLSTDWRQIRLGSIDGSIDNRVRIRLAFCRQSLLMEYDSRLAAESGQDLQYVPFKYIGTTDTARFHSVIILCHRILLYFC